ncbi:MAG TPA: efflux RND transporter permease subunit [Devosiaceae bacterium]|jgi:HAE1 family hydrophobic/amphiphilic exporter-1
MSIQSQNSRGGVIASLFVRRPVLAAVVNALIVVAGLAAFFGIEVRELPSVEQPQLSIRTTYDGAAAETVDKEITSVVENAVARVPGVASISSTSSYANSRVSLGFNDGTNIDTASSDVRDAVSRLTRQLPDNIDPPTIVKADSDASSIMQLSVTSDTISMGDLSQLVDDTISDRLAAVPGVADVQVYGEQNNVFQVDVDQAKLASLGLTAADVSKVLATASFDAPAGSLNGANQNINVLATAAVNTPEEFEDLTIKDKIKLGDVATVVFAPSTASSGLRADGKTGIGLGIVRQAQSNTVQISQDVHAAVAELQNTLPKGVAINISSDDSVFISGAIEEVERSLIVAVVVVIAVIFMFLLDWRATLIPAITMPVALIGTMAGVYLAGFSINILTLLALVLATGLVVDDAIVVLENIVRRRGMGMGPRAAAVLGTQEVFFAVVATTATLAAVFVPLSFLPGQTGRLFREFGFTLAMSVGLSCVVALTLAPMLASRLLKHADSMHGGGNPGLIHRFLNAIGGVCGKFYRVTLHACLQFPFAVVLVALMFAGSAYFVFVNLRQELTPSEDRSAIMLSIRAPNTVSLDYTRTEMRQIEDLLQPLKASGEIQSIFSISGFGSNTSSGFMTLTLAPWDKRTRSQQAITADINKLLVQVPGVTARTLSANSLGIRGGGNGLQFAILGSDYTQLYDVATKMQDQMQKDPRFGRIQISYDPTQPQLTLTVDRQKASALGIDFDGLSTTMQAMIDGADEGNVFINDKSYTITMMSTTNEVNDPSDLASIFIKTSDGRYVPMSTIATLVESPIAPSLGREEQRRAVSVTASLGDGMTLGDAYTQALQIAQPLLQQGDSIIPLAEAKTLGEANNGLYVTFGFALVVILLVLAAQFESVWSALIVMATVPFGLACAIYALQLTGGTLNVYSQIGLILVVGIMAKNGILIVEFANQLRDQGRSVAEAIEEASNIRLRPVLMTMIATVLGGLPLVISHGAGAEARQALGWIIMGGLGPAAVSTLYLTPVAYLLLARFSKAKAEEEARLERELDEAHVVGLDDEPAPQPAPVLRAAE